MRGAEAHHECDRSATKNAWGVHKQGPFLLSHDTLVTDIASSVSHKGTSKVALLRGAKGLVLTLHHRAVELVQGALSLGSRRVLDGTNAS